MVDKITNPPSQKDLIDKVNELVDDKQDTLVSGTNIKTINNTSILGSGNIDIQGGSSYTAGTGININNDVISVTNDISAGAALGATALQSGDNISELVNNSGYITSSALNGYATQAWVGQQGYITGINSSDVTTALGYTPYNASNPDGYITSSALTPYVLSADLASVATSGSYNDLSNKPTIPSEVTESTVSGWGFTKNTGTVTSVNNVSPVNGNVTLSIPTVPTNISAFTNDAGYITNSALTGYATENYVDTGLATKQATLVSGTNIKTVNGNSLLGSGNIVIQGGGSSYTAGTGIDITNNVISAKIATSVSSTSTNEQSVGAKLFYDTVGDIETLINAL